MNISAVVQRFDTGPTEELAPALTDALEDIERNLDELPRAVDAGHAAYRLARKLRHAADVFDAIGEALEP